MPAEVRPTPFTEFLNPRADFGWVESGFPGRLG